ncbi:MAG: hypothetical protein J5986_13885 [Roseburia sp.]|nr:hypothetical protein [Roseburia sp.]
MSIKIAFCGETEGNTANMFSLAWMAALQKPAWAVLVERREKRYILWKGVSKQQLLFLDCGEGKTRRAKKYWKEADIRVLYINPEQKNLEQYLLCKTPGEESPLFLVGNYHGEKKEIKSCLKNFYRIEEENVGWLPYNNEYAYAFERGKAAQFIRRYYRGERTEHDRRFFEELEHSFFLLQKKLETIENDQKIGGNHLWNR